MGVISGRSFSDQAEPLGPSRSHRALTRFLCSFPRAAPPHPTPGLPRLLFIPSFPAAKMSLSPTVTSWPEPHSPEESDKLQTPEQDTQQASSGDVPSTHREDTQPGLGTLRRAFSRARWRALGQAPGEDAGLLRRSSHFLRSLRRPRDDGRAAAPGRARSPEGPSGVTDGGRRPSTTGVGPEEPGQEEGESFTKDTKHGRKLRPKREQHSPGFPTAPPNTPMHNCILHSPSLSSRGASTGQLREARVS